MIAAKIRIPKKNETTVFVGLFGAPPGGVALKRLFTSPNDAPVPGSVHDVAASKFIIIIVRLSLTNQFL